MAKFPALMSLIHVEFTGKPEAALRYRTRASKLGMSEAL